MERILVPSDFSECSYAAIFFAAKIAALNNAELHILNVIEIPSTSNSFAFAGDWIAQDEESSSEIHFMMQLMQEAKLKIEELRQHPDLQNIRIVDTIEIGKTSSQISGIAAKHNVDLIVMGTHGSGGVNNFFIGSNAEKIVRMADRPVLTIKCEVPRLPKDIVFASDFSEEADLVFPTVQKFAALFGARIHLLKVNTIDSFETTRESREPITRFIANHNIKDYDFTLYNDVVKEAGIIHFAKDIDADIIALGTHGRNGLNNMFSGSITEDLVNHAFCPVFTVNFHRGSK